MTDYAALLDRAIGKTEKIAHTADGKFPACGFGADGRYLCADDITWTDGFFPGMLGIAYARTGKEKYLAAARVYDAAYDIKAGEKLSLHDHDLGFLFSLKDVFDYKLTGSGFHRRRALTAAYALLGRYNERAGILPAWDFHPFDPSVDYRGRIICDTMMNLPLLMWAYTETGDEKFRTAAVSHAEKSAENLIRPDGSSFHVFDFNPETGAAIGGDTMQGYSKKSCWARGQAWLIYGFALMYRYTGIEKFRAASERTAKYFTEKLPPDGVPLWDFGVSNLRFRPWDASAGAVAACGLLQLAGQSGGGYETAAKRLLDALVRHCSALEDDGIQPLLLHTCGSPAYRKGSELTLAFDNADTAIIFGDYFFMEALMRAAQPEWEGFAW